MAFSFLSHHILHTCSGVRLQWNKSTICFTFRGVAIDLNVSWVKKELHSYVELSLYLRACLSPQSVDEWKLILESARQTGIAQQRGGPRGSHLKTVVLSLLLAAAKQLDPLVDLYSGSDQLIHLVVCLFKFVSKLSHEFMQISMRYDEVRRDIVFQLQPKRAPDTLCERARLVIVNELGMDIWHGRGCVQTQCTVGAPEVLKWLSTFVPRTRLRMELPLVLPLMDIPSDDDLID